MPAEDDAPRLRTQGRQRTENIAARSITRRTRVRPLDPARELDAWELTVLHLHACGLPAAVPQLVARQLRRRGVVADWTTAA